jgi:hypothetical protein
MANKDIIIRVKGVPDGGSLHKLMYSEKKGKRPYEYSVSHYADYVELSIPSEEEIDNYIKECKAPVRTIMSDFADAGFKAGAEWIINKLLNQ